MGINYQIFTFDGRVLKEYVYSIPEDILSSKSKISFDGFYFSNKLFANFVDEREHYAILSF